MTDKEVMQMALDIMESAIKAGDWVVDGACDPDLVLNALRAALAQPEQEPVAWWHDRGDVVDLNVSRHGTPLYFAPPQREWQGLTDDEVDDIRCDFATLGGDIEGKNWFAFYLALFSLLKQS